MDFFYDSGADNIWQAVTDSTFFLILQFLVAIYVTVLLANIIMLIYLGDLRAQLRSLRRGTSHQPLSAKNIKKKWVKITERLESDHENQWKVAVLEADDVVNNYFAAEGYHGDHFAERIAQIPEGHDIDFTLVTDAHALRNAIVHDETYELTIDRAEEAIDAYHALLEDLNVV